MADTVVQVAPADGGRIAQLTIDGHDLLWDDPTGGPRGGPTEWGCYPMVPWAGRLGNARFVWEGEEIHLDPLFAPHAIHGTAFRRPWDVVGADGTSVELTCPLDWPLGGSAGSVIRLGEATLTWELSATAGRRSMPVSLGWHPWFRRPVELDVAFVGMYAKGSDGLPDGRVVPPPPPPWDDCFVHPEHPPRLRSGPVRLEITSDCSHWVVFTERDYAVCVEPQTAPPDAVHLGCVHVLAPGETLTRQMTWAWS